MERSRVLFFLSVIVAVAMFSGTAQAVSCTLDLTGGDECKKCANDLHIDLQHKGLETELSVNVENLQNCWKQAKLGGCEAKVSCK
jgi:hypothetical protein